MPSNPDHHPPPPAAGAATVHPPPPKPTPKLLSLLRKALIITFIPILSSLFLGVAAIFLLLATAARHLHSNPANDNNPSSGLRDLKRRLPQFRFSRRGGETDECAVCLDSIKQGQWCRKLPGCGHVFHRRCVDPWLVKVLACPICRAKVQRGNSAEEEERNGGWGIRMEERIRGLVERYYSFLVSRGYAAASPLQEEDSFLSPVIGMNRFLTNLFLLPGNDSRGGFYSFLAELQPSMKEERQKPE